MLPQIFKLNQLLLLASLLFLTPLFGQSKVDSIIFNKVNEFRKENGVDAIKWSGKLGVLCKAHSNYVLKTEENMNENGFQKKINYIFDEKYNYYTEAVERFSYVWNEIKELHTYIGKKKGELTDKEVADAIFNSWKSNQECVNNMLNRDLVFGSVATIIKGNNFIFNQRIICVFNISEIQ